MNRTDLRARSRAVVAGLRRRAGTAQGSSRWAWAADATLAAFLSACTVDLVWKGPGDVQETTKVFLSEPPAALPPRPPLPPPPGFPHGLPEDPLHLMTRAPAPLWLLALAAAVALPLAVRRRCPLTAFWAVTGLGLAFQLSARRTIGVQEAAVFTFAAFLIAAYSAAIHAARGRPLAANLLAGTAVTAAFHDAVVPSVTPGFVPFLLLLPLGLAANTVHTWRQRVRTLEVEREAATRLAVERERARIARELHDVVTHNVSMMTVQAGAARKVLPARPELAAQALLAVEAGGRSALAELRHVMGLLTMPADPDGPGPAALAPQPGLGELDALAGRVRDAGTPVELIVRGTAGDLPPGVELAAYRVVQEALTNTVKHAAGAAVTVRVEHLPGNLRIEVRDTGGARGAKAAPGSGRGLIGLRERLALYGGTLDAGALLTGGFRVRAVLPVGEA